MITDITLTLLAETVAGAVTTTAASPPAPPAGGSTTTGAYPEIAHIMGALAKLVVLSMCLERAFAFLFEWEWSRRVLEKPVHAGQPLEMESRLPGLKAFITLMAAWTIGHHFPFDIPQVLFGTKQPDTLGIAVTSFVVAGGSSGAIALFQGALGFHKPTRDAQIAAKRTQAEASAVGAQADLVKARSDKWQAKSLFRNPESPKT